MKVNFDVSGKVVVITGGTGILCSEMARQLGEQGCKVAVLGRNREKADELVREIMDAGGCAMGVTADVLDKSSLIRAREEIIKEFGRIDVLINGAGGNRKDATAGNGVSFFDLPEDALQWVVNLNFMGTVLSTQVFGEVMAEQKEGCIINVSSMASLTPLTNVVGYGAAKASVNNFTQWMAVYLNQNYSDRLRVNAIAPGFFLTQQNRFLLTDEQTGEDTLRGKTIRQHTPMGRYGKPEDLLGTVIWLMSDASSFVNGVVIPIDGGFSAFSGV